MSFTFTVTTQKHESFIAMIDDCDRDLLQHKWYLKRGRKTNYLRRGVKDVTVLFHRVIMERIVGRPLTDDEHVDHIDMNGLNNQRVNLRVGTRAQNRVNSAADADNKLGIKGVYKKGNRYIAAITIDNVARRLGSFMTAEQAHDAYLDAARKHFGEFVRSK